MDSDPPQGNTQFVLAALERDRSFVTARELHRRVRRLGRPMAISTVYGILRDLVKQNVIDVIVGEHNQRSYRRCSTRPHHHLVCSMCHTTVEIPALSSSLPEWTPEEALGFTDVLVRVTITGTCAECTQSG